MKQETLKEASDNYAEKVFNDRPNLDNDSKIWLVGGSIEGFKEGVKWQQQQGYSEEEVLKLILASSKLPFVNDEERIEWFEQFKNK